MTAGATARGTGGLGALATLIVAAALLAGGMTGCTPARRKAPEGRGREPSIRVLIAEETGSLAIEANGGFRVASENGMTLMQSADPSRVTVRRQGTSTQIELRPQGNVAVAEGNIFVAPTGNTQLRYEGSAYGGRMVVRQVAGTEGVQVINVVPLEQYLEGVLPHEIGDPGPDAYAAVEAQAVAARTYAVSRIRDRRGEPFDVYSGIRDQIYRGIERTNRLASGAVRETRGRVLTYKGELARTYYSATCGGHTSDIRFVWPDREPAPYLRGVLDRNHDGSYCAWASNFRWQFAFSGEELGEMLRETLPAELDVDPGRVGYLIDVAVSESTASGRARYLEVVTTEGSFTVEGDRIRWVLAPDYRSGRILPSTMFRLEKQMQEQRVTLVRIVGGGNGHGVGMCQNGAIGMARQGYTIEMILAHYYPGTETAKWY
jgi:stage II sporulation protein D